MIATRFDGRTIRVDKASERPSGGSGGGFGGGRGGTSPFISGLALILISLQAATAAAAAGTVAAVVAAAATAVVAGTKVAEADTAASKAAVCAFEEFPKYSADSRSRILWRRPEQLARRRRWRWIPAGWLRGW